MQYSEYTMMQKYEFSEVQDCSSFLLYMCMPIVKLFAGASLEARVNTINFISNKPHSRQSCQLESYGLLNLLLQIDGNFLVHLIQGTVLSAI